MYVVQLEILLCLHAFLHVHTYQILNHICFYLICSPSNLTNITQDGQVKNTRNQRACLRALMRVVEAEDVCQDGKGRGLLSLLIPMGKKALSI